MENMISQGITCIVTTEKGESHDKRRSDKKTARVCASGGR